MYFPKFNCLNKFVSSKGIEKQIKWYTYRAKKKQHNNAEIGKMHCFIIISSISLTQVGGRYLFWAYVFLVPLNVKGITT